MNEHVFRTHNNLARHSVIAIPLRIGLKTVSNVLFTLNNFAIYHVTVKHPGIR